MSQIVTILPALNAAAHLERTLQSLTEAERAGLSAGRGLMADQRTTRCRLLAAPDARW